MKDQQSKNLTDFTKYKNDKEGKLTAEEIITFLYEDMKQGLIKDIVFVSVGPNNEVAHGCNDMDVIRIMGMLDVGKMQIMDAVKECRC